MCSSQMRHVAAPNTGQKGTCVFTGPSQLPTRKGRLIESVRTIYGTFFPPEIVSYEGPEPLVETRAICVCFANEEPVPSYNKANTRVSGVPFDLSGLISSGVRVYLQSSENETGEHFSQTGRHLLGCCISLDP